MNTEDIKNSKLLVTPAPHAREKVSSFEEMRSVGIALLPATILSIVFFGWQSIILLVVAIVSAIIFERLSLKLRGLTHKKEDISSAVITAVLLVFCISPAVPWWMVIVGTFVAIVVTKHFFGGLGHNIFNPALIGRAFMMASWPLIMTTWLKPSGFSLDAITTATALSKVDPANVSYLQLFLGNVAGSIGETSALALLLGAAYMLWKGTIDWKIPGSYLVTVAAMALIFNVDPLFHLLAGGLILGAFYMATDHTTSPSTKWGRIIFGAGCGVITMVIRLWGGYPEGVCYSILLMNATVPLLDKLTQGRVFGNK